MNKVAGVTIIGAGPAGIAAAIQLKRYGITPLLLEKNMLGGLLRNANLVENYPGFPVGISGLHLTSLFGEQLKNLSIQPIKAGVTRVKFEDGLFLVETGTSVYYSQIIVVASGTKPVQLTGFDIPASLQGKIYYQVVPLLQESGVVIAIVGAGDAAFDYALNLAKTNQVIILNRGFAHKCLPLLWERAELDPKIRYIDNACIESIYSNQEGGMMVQYKVIEGTSSFQVDYLVGAIGRVPNTDFLSDQVTEQREELQSAGLLYFIGDVKNDIYRQASIAVGDGVRSAMQIFRTEKGLFS
jgi:thioredoxin reductase (NADPH)